MKWQVPATAGDSTIIAPGGFLVWFADEDGSQGWNHMNFKLSSQGEPIALRSPDGFSVADSVFMPSVMQDRSWGRQFDAHPNWVEFLIPTPNATNGANNVVELESASLMCFPNPVRAHGDVTFNQAVDIYDMQGRLVQSMAAAGVWNANLPAGTYAVVAVRQAGVPGSVTKLQIQ